MNNPNLTFSRNSNHGISKPHSLHRPTSTPLIPPSPLSSDIPPPLTLPPPPPFYFSEFLDNFSPSTSQTFQDGSNYSLPQSTPYQAVERLNESVVGIPFDKASIQSWVDSWIRNRNFLTTREKNNCRGNLKIFVIKEKFNTASKLIKELENDVRTLGVMVKTVTPHEWDQKCNEIEEKKKKLNNALKELKMSKEDINAVKEKCTKRSKKRARQKRQAEQRKKQKEEEQVRNQNINFQIDNWQREMQEGVERIQREEELQREADAVLWSVTQKKTEAQRHVALLSALLELRQVRAKRLAAAGNSVSETQIQTFNSVIERLKKMWSKHLEGCLLEEQVLRGMLTEAEIKDDPVKTYKKLVLQEWENVLFGSVGTLDSNPTGDELVQIRQGWDRFVSQEHTILASTIPPGWVLPVCPSTAQWHSLLKY